MVPCHIISNAKSEAMTLSRKPVDCLLRVGNESLYGVQVPQGLVGKLGYDGVRLAGESEQRGWYCERFTSPL